MVSRTLGWHHSLQVLFGIGETKCLYQCEIVHLNLNGYSSLANSRKVSTQVLPFRNEIWLWALRHYSFHLICEALFLQCRKKHLLVNDSAARLATILFSLCFKTGAIFRGFRSRSLASNDGDKKTFKIFLQHQVDKFFFRDIIRHNFAATWTEADFSRGRILSRAGTSLGSGSDARAHKWAHT